MAKPPRQSTEDTRSGFEPSGSASDEAAPAPVPGALRRFAGFMAEVLGAKPGSAPPSARKLTPATAAARAAQKQPSVAPPARPRAAQPPQQRWEPSTAPSQFADSLPAPESTYPSHVSQDDVHENILFHVLRTRLDRAQDLRHYSKTLRKLEEVLRRSGEAGLAEMSVEDLRAATLQLSTLENASSDVSLQELRSRMQARIDAAEAPARAAQDKAFDDQRATAPPAQRQTRRLLTPGSSEDRPTVEPGTSSAGARRRQALDNLSRQPPPATAPPVLAKAVRAPDPAPVAAPPPAPLAAQAPEPAPAPAQALAPAAIAVQAAAPPAPQQPAPIVQPAWSSMLRPVGAPTNQAPAPDVHVSVPSTAAAATAGGAQVETRKPSSEFSLSHLGVGDIGVDVQEVPDDEAFHLSFETDLGVDVQHVQNLEPFVPRPELDVQIDFGTKPLRAPRRHQS